MDHGKGKNSLTSSELGRALDVHDEVRGFIRVRAVLPLLIHTVLLVLVLFNLAVARSEEGMGGKVLWSAFGFGVLILTTWLCLYRSSDETSGVVAPECRPPRRQKVVPLQVETGLAESASSHQWS